MHVLQNAVSLIQMKKLYLNVSITSTKTYEVDEPLVCERKSGDRYASSSPLFVRQSCY